MQLNHSTIVLVSATITHSVVVGIASYMARKGRPTRTKSLWSLMLAEGLVFVVGLFILSILMQPQSLLDSLSQVVYVTIGAFVIALEVPGYMILSKHDENIIKGLGEIRSILVRTALSFDYVNQLKDKTRQYQQILDETALKTLLDDFISSCERMKNIDRNFWSIVLSEVTRVIADVSQRSKHPVPKLIDVLTLAGLGFLLAQLLRVWG